MIKRNWLMEMNIKVWKMRYSDLHQRLQALEEINPSSSFDLVSYDSSSRNPASLASSSSTPTWVIDSCVTDHVTGICLQFHSYSPSSHGSFKSANGTFKQVAGKGSICLTWVVAFICFICSTILVYLFNQNIKLLWYLFPFLLCILESEDGAYDWWWS